MCGIMGWSITKKLQVSREQRAILAAILSTRNDTRGGDSWGYYDFESLKRGLDDIAPMSLPLASLDRVMAHTRKATTGSKTVENAHPFDIGNIIGAHNGIITNHESLNKKYNRNYQVDSMHLFGHLNEGLPFNDLYGYGAIEYVKKDNPNRIYLCRMKSGELSIYGLGSQNVKDAKGVMWSSDERHALEALKASNIPYFEYKVESENVYFIEDGKLYHAIDDKGEHLELNLGSRTDSYLPDWRNGLQKYYGTDFEESEYDDQKSMSFADKSEYNEFKRLWKGHIGIDDLEDLQAFEEESLSEKFIFNHKK